MRRSRGHRGVCSIARAHNCARGDAQLWARAMEQESGMAHCQELHRRPTELQYQTTLLDSLWSTQ